MSLTLTILGCSGSYAGPGGACSGYLVRSDTTCLWIDTGPGTVANLQRHVRLEDVDALVVSHQHPDHCGELAVLYNAYKWYVTRGLVPVHAPAGVERVVRASCGDTTDVFDWHIVSDGAQTVVGDLSVTFERTDHTVETMAVRVEHAGRSIVYTADTAPGWDMTDFAAGASLLLGEATVLHADHRPEVPHLSARHLGDAARRARVERLVVTHVDPRGDVAAHVAEAAAAYGGPTEPAVVGGTHTI